MIELENLRAGYGKKEILHGVSLSVPEGKITAVIGKNGSGKSTLLKAMAGIIPVSSGTMRIDGKNAAELTRKSLAQKAAYLPQGRSVPDMTVRQLVLHGRFPYLGYPRRYGEKDKRIASEALRKMGISELSERELSSLSGGMRQNAYIAMALAQDAGYILLDEPTTYLDIFNQLSLMRTLRSLAGDGKGIAAVMHDIPLALSFSDSVVVLRGGEVAFAGTPEDAVSGGIIEKSFGVPVYKQPDGSGYCYRI